MARAGKYDEMAERIIALVGGKDNINHFAHCVTRIRFDVRDKALVRTEEINKLPGAMGSVWSGDQLQVVIGQAVDDAYRLICEKNGIQEADAVDENLDAPTGGKGKVTFVSVMGDIAGCITPLIPVFVGTGFIKVIALLLELGGILTPGMPTDVVLNFVGDAGFYFMPIYIGAFTARRFGANQALGMLVGGMLIHPTFVAAIADGTALDFVGIPIYPASYASTVFPVILSVWVMSFVEKFFAKHSPEAIRNIVEPLGTLLVMIPLTFCLLGPIGAFLGSYLAVGIMAMYNSVGWIAVAIIAAFWPFLVMTGMHASLVPFLFDSIARTGQEFLILTGSIIADVDQGVAALAVALKTKDPNLRSNGISTGVTAVLSGIIEPAMYGVNLPCRTPLITSAIGSGIGGIIAGIARCHVNAMVGSAGVLGGLPAYLGDPLSNFIWMAIALGTGMVLTFVLTYAFYRPTEAESARAELAA
jgi:PTS system beta-glucosides-specific IIC component